MRDADYEALWAEDIPPPTPVRRNTARVRALDAFDKTHRRGIGAAVACHLVRSSAPAWRLVRDTLDSPWTPAWLRLATSLIAVITFAMALIATFMIAG